MLPKSTRPQIGGATAASVLLPRAAVSCSFLILSITAMAESPSATSPPKAPSAPQDITAVEGVRLQPRGNNFAPNYAEEAAVQERLTIFNTQQDVLDFGVRPEAENLSGLLIGPMSVLSRRSGI